MERILHRKSPPMRRLPHPTMAIKQPQSIFARLHTWHKTWWPGWKAHQAQGVRLRARASTHV